MENTIDMSPVIKRLDHVEGKINELTNYTVQIGSSMEETRQSVQEVKSELEELSRRFLELMEENQRIANLQQAGTELVRVRQQIENEFSSYRVIRETMLGVLQATDLALVKKSTISRVSEELMLSTPDYWLAPCLVAVAAWIGNDKDLAERAIKEAVKRDKERTSLTMALICRRNQRTTTCYEWLQMYFSTQNGNHFSEGSFTYVDAYLNGVFGPDENHMCDDYITKWMNEVHAEQTNSFDEQQAQIWKEYCEKYAQNMDEMYPDLCSNVQEYSLISDYLGRIYSVNSISNNFKNITTAYVDREKLVKDIDAHLITLVSRYDKHEEPLRKEEEMWQEIKNQNGNKEKADAIIKMRELERKEKTLNLVQQMTKVIISEDNTSMSEKKTAVSFLGGYIRKGFEHYMDEKKELFPEKITINVDGRTGIVSEDTTVDSLCMNYTAFMQNERNRAVEQASKNNSMIKMILAIACVGLGVVLGFSSSLFFLFAGIVGGVIIFMKMQKAKKESVTKVQQVQSEYEGKIIAGKNKIMAVFDQWNKAKNAVHTYHSADKVDIIA